MFKTSLRKQNLKIVNINRDIPRETLLIFSYLYKRKNCSVSGSGMSWKGKGREGRADGEGKGIEGMIWRGWEE